MSLIAQYVAVIILDWARYQPTGGSLQTLRDQFASRVGGHLSTDDVGAAMQILENFGASSADYSPLTGGYWKLTYDNFRYYFVEDRAEEEDDQAEYSEIKKQTDQYPVLQAYARQGSDYAKDARERLKAAGFEDWIRLRQEDAATIAVPASDRIVSLDHNQSAAAERSVNQIVEAIEADNGDPEQPGLRERLLGQIKAGRELIRAGEFKAYLLYETLVRALGELIKKYKNPTIVALANALLGAVVSQLIQA